MGHAWNVAPTTHGRNPANMRVTIGICLCWTRAGSWPRAGWRPSSRCWSTAASRARPSGSASRQPTVSQLVQALERERRHRAARARPRQPCGRRPPARALRPHAARAAGGRRARGRGRAHAPTATRAATCASPPARRWRRTSCRRRRLAAARAAARARGDVRGRRRGARARGPARRRGRRGAADRPHRGRATSMAHAYAPAGWCWCRRRPTRWRGRRTVSPGRPRAARRSWCATSARSTGASSRSCCGGRGVEPRARLVASSLEAVKRCVEAGLGVTVVPSIAVERELAEGLLVELALRARPRLRLRALHPPRRAAAAAGERAAGDPAGAGDRLTRSGTRRTMCRNRPATLLPLRK